MISLLTTTGLASLRVAGGRRVDNHPVIPRSQMTPLCDVRDHCVPVDITALVYAGRNPSYPQSTGLITAISMYPTTTNNHPTRPTS
jgi:hypothetical protein